MAEIPKAALSVHYDKEMEEEEKNKETKAQRQKAGSAPLCPQAQPSQKGGNLRHLLETAMAVGNLAIGTDAKSTLSQV